MAAKLYNSWRDKDTVMEIDVHLKGRATLGADGVRGRSAGVRVLHAGRVFYRRTSFLFVFTLIFSHQRVVVIELSDRR